MNFKGIQSGLGVYGLLLKPYPLCFQFTHAAHHTFHSTSLNGLTKRLDANLLVSQILPFRSILPVQTKEVCRVQLDVPGHLLPKVPKRVVVGIRSTADKIGDQTTVSRAIFKTIIGPRQPE